MFVSANMLSLRADLSREFSSCYKLLLIDGSSRYVSMTQHCLEELDSTINDKFRVLNEEAINVIMKAVEAKLTSHIAVISSSSTNYCLDEAQFRQIECSHFVSLIMDNCSANIVALKGALTDNNYCAIILATIHMITNQIEKLVRTKKFNFWGNKTHKHKLTTL